ncbi:hypothetical protein BDR22DRAFT_969349 [Usnea florida]
MLVKNINENLVNGSLGKVVGLWTTRTTIFQKRETQRSHRIQIWHCQRRRPNPLSSKIHISTPGKNGHLSDSQLQMELSQETIDVFRSLERPLEFNDDIEATELFPTRHEVDKANAARLEKLNGSVIEYKGTDGGNMEPNKRKRTLDQGCMASTSLLLKKGAQVMLVKNIDENLVNRSLGRVVGFMDDKNYDLAKEGDAVEAQEPAEHTVVQDPELNPRQKWPLVRFSFADGTSRDLLCQQETWKMDLDGGDTKISRKQVPLILAWALSIHKAQGQTLERVKVDSHAVKHTCKRRRNRRPNMDKQAKIECYHEVRVALSRATSLRGLQVFKFNPFKVVADPRVGEFYRDMSAKRRGAVSGGDEFGASAGEEELMLAFE